MAFTAYLSTLYALARSLTQTSATSLPDASLLLLANEAYLDASRQLALRGIDVTGGVATADLVAGQTDYALPTDCLSVARLEVNYDDPTDDNMWRKMEQVDVPNLPDEWFQFLASSTTGSPFFDLFGAQLYVSPVASTSQLAAIRIWYLRKPSDFSGSSPATEAIPYPFNLYYDVLAYGVAWRYFRPLNSESMATYVALYNDAIKRMLDALDLRSSEPIKPRIADNLNSGWM